MLLRFLWSCVLIMVCCYNANASHVVGGEITYQCVNQLANSYEITFKLYRDCSGIAVPNTVTVNFSSTGGCSSLGATLTRVNPIGVDVSPLCPTSISTCQGGTNPGVEEYIYTGITTLPANCGVWTISYGACCRSGAITNLQNSSSQGLYIEATLNSDVASCNNSAQFSVAPVIYTCAGYPTYFNHGAYDPDADSLRFTLISAQDNPPSNIPYVGGLSATNPIALAPGTSFSIDSLTGQLVFTPASSVAQQAVITILVEEIRNGVVIGSTIKELQVTVLPCNNNPVQLDSVVLLDNGNRTVLPTNEIPGCSGQTVHLEFYFSDDDVLDVVQYNANLSTIQQWFPNAVVSSTHPPSGAQNELIVDVQIPGIVAGTGFILTLSDNACPLISQVSFDFVISTSMACPEISGKIVLDDNNNCTYDSTDLDFIKAHVIVEKGNFSVITHLDSNGCYSVAVDTGTYTVRTELIHPYWSVCTNNISSNLSTYSSHDTVNFVVEEEVSCPLIYVNIAAPQLINCRENYYHVNYCNYGTDTAFGAYIEVELDTLFRVDSASISITSQVGNVYTFYLGNLDVDDCGSFNIYGYLDPNCDPNNLGRTFCATAHAYPDSTCFTPVGWSGADLIAEAQCLGDSVALRLRNVGSNMLAGQTLEVIKDNYLIHTQAFNLAAGMSTPWLVYYADGATYRLQAPQAPNHPWGTEVSVSVEGCVDTATAVSTGFVHIFSPNDDAPFVSVDCQVALFAWDPNDKQAFPAGYGPQHAIDKNTSLKYRIRFQNTGTAPALDVQIKDVLSPHLDLFSIELLGASHPYNWNIGNNNTLVVNFPNINLPDSTSNEPASHGYVDFRIRQQPNNSVGTVINNSAEIYFDNNPAVITNTVFHTIDSGFIIPLVAYQIDTILCDSFVFHNTTYVNTGTYTQGVYQPNEYSSYTLNLTINNPEDTTINTTVCDSFVFNGFTYTASGNYVQNLTAANNCDSTIYLDLVITTPQDTTLNTTSCDSFVLNNVTYTSSGNYVQNLTTVNNCDSTIFLDLVINTPRDTTLNATSCDSLVFNGFTYTTSGMYVQNLTTANNCDSTVRLDLMINNSSNQSLTINECDSFVAPDGQVYYAGGNYTATITNSEGCDSLIDITLTVNTINTMVQQVGIDLISNQPVGTNTTYQWIDCDNGNSPINGATSQSFVPANNGNYAVQITNGTCSTTSDCINYVMVGTNHLATENAVSIYPNPTKNVVYIQQEKLAEELEITVTDQLGRSLQTMLSQTKRTTLDLTKWESGIYFITIQNAKKTIVYKIIKQ